MEGVSDPNLYPTRSAHETDSLLVPRSAKSSSMPVSLAEYVPDTTREMGSINGPDGPKVSVYTLSHPEERSCLLDDAKSFDWRARIRNGPDEYKTFMATRYASLTQLLGEYEDLSSTEPPESFVNRIATSVTHAYMEMSIAEATGKNLTEINEALEALDKTSLAEHKAFFQKEITGGRYDILSLRGLAHAKMSMTPTSSMFLDERAHKLSVLSARAVIESLKAAKNTAPDELLLLPFKEVKGPKKRLYRKDLPLHSSIPRKSETSRLPNYDATRSSPDPDSQL